MRGRRKRIVKVSPLLLLLCTAACCEREGMEIENFQFGAEIIYQEPACSGKPVLIFPRDIIFLKGNLYVLDGRLAHVAVFEPESGTLRFVFGGLGEGPGELGQFPYALVTDGCRVGVAHLFHVSWFTSEGRFLTRETLPAIDLSSPSIQYSGDGWMCNTPFHGEGSPVASYFTRSGDTTRFGESVLPERSVGTGLASMELNAVHACRYANGNVLVSWIHSNRIELYSNSANSLASDSWTHFPERVDRHPDGRLRGMPGFVLSASEGADGLVYLLDGTGRVIRAYSSGGKLRAEYRSVVPVIRLAWAGKNLAYGIDGSDRVLRLRPVESSEKLAGAEEFCPAGRSSSDITSANKSPLPGEIVARISNLKTLFHEWGIWREGGPVGVSSKPARIVAAGGKNLLYLGYEDGQGLLLDECENGEWRVERESPSHREGSLRSRIHMAGDLPVIVDPAQGIFYTGDEVEEVNWTPGTWSSSVIWLGGSEWLVHDTLEQDADPLFTLDLETGQRRPAGGGGNHRKAGALFEPAYNWWHLVRWEEEEVLIFDESEVRLSIWSGGDLSDWKSVTGTGLRTISERKGELTPERDLDGILPVAGIGFIVYISEFNDGVVRNTAMLVSVEGETLARWELPLAERIGSMTSGSGDTILISTQGILYEWINAVSEVRVMLER